MLQLIIKISVIVRVPGHISISGNETADAMAKDAA
jgi:ribonuclease HI